MGIPTRLQWDNWVILTNIALPRAQRVQDSSICNLVARLELGGQVVCGELTAQLWKKTGSHSQGQASPAEEGQFLGLWVL